MAAVAGFGRQFAFILVLLYSAGHHSDRYLRYLKFNTVSLGCSRSSIIV
jgi:hypothetical protein